MIKRIKLFIKAWKHYPKMVVFVRERFGIERPSSRFHYAWFVSMEGRKIYKGRLKNKIFQNLRAD